MVVTQTSRMTFEELQRHDVEVEKVTVTERDRLWEVSTLKASFSGSLWSGSGGWMYRQKVICGGYENSTAGRSSGNAGLL